VAAPVLGAEVEVGTPRAGRSWNGLLHQPQAQLVGVEAGRSPAASAVIIVMVGAGPTSRIGRVLSQEVVACQPYHRFRHPGKGAVGGERLRDGSWPAMTNATPTTSTPRPGPSSSTGPAGAGWEERFEDFAPASSAVVLHTRPPRSFDGRAAVAAGRRARADSARRAAANRFVGLGAGRARAARCPSQPRACWAPPRVPNVEARWSCFMPLPLGGCLAAPLRGAPGTRRCRPPVSDRAGSRAWSRWAWLVGGRRRSGSRGQTRPRPPPLSRGGCGKGPRGPNFPRPARADALLLGGSVFDLLAAPRRASAPERGITLGAAGPHPDGPLRAASEIAFPRAAALRHTERAWRSHLSRDFLRRPAAAAAGTRTRRRTTKVGRIHEQRHQREPHRRQAHAGPTEAGAGGPSTGPGRRPAARGSRARGVRRPKRRRTMVSAGPGGEGSPARSEALPIGRHERRECPPPAARPLEQPSRLSLVGAPSPLRVSGAPRRSRGRTLRAGARPSRSADFRPSVRGVRRSTSGEAGHSVQKALLRLVVRGAVRHTSRRGSSVEPGASDLRGPLVAGRSTTCAGPGSSSLTPDDQIQRAGERAGRFRAAEPWRGLMSVWTGPGQRRVCE